MPREKSALHRLIDIVRNQEKPGAKSDLYIVIGAGTVSIGFGAPDDSGDFLPGIPRHLADDESVYLSIDEMAQDLLNDLAEQSLKSGPQKPAPPPKRRRR